MILMACAENAMGMRFNGRRCSRDRAVYQDMVHRAPEGLWMEAGSLALFRELPQEGLHGVLSPAEVPEDGCFFAERPVEDLEPERIFLYRWNRDYPSDEKFQFPAGNWVLREQTEFSGFSHPVITLEIYERGEKDHGEEEIR